MNATATNIISIAFLHDTLASAAVRERLFADEILIDEDGKSRIKMSCLSELYNAWCARVFGKSNGAYVLSTTILRRNCHVALTSILSELDEFGHVTGASTARFFVSSSELGFYAKDIELHAKIMRRFSPIPTELKALIQKAETDHKAAIEAYQWLFYHDAYQAKIVLAAAKLKVLAEKKRKEIEQFDISEYKTGEIQLGRNEDPKNVHKKLLLWEKAALSNSFPRIVDVVDLVSHSRIPSASIEFEILDGRRVLVEAIPDCITAKREEWRVAVEEARKLVKAQRPNRGAERGRSLNHTNSTPTC